MSYGQILKKSLSVTTTQPRLWALGIFLSSGFNLHWWYLLSWLKSNGFIAKVYANLAGSHPIVLGLAGAVLLGAGLFIVIFLKLWFFLEVHNSLHGQDEAKCFLCNRIRKGSFDNSVSSVLKLLSRGAILWRVYLASLITMALTTSILGLFSYYQLHSGQNFIKSIVLVVCLLLALVIISLWNMLVVLFVFWYEQNFSKASNLAIELLVKKLKPTLGLTVILTFIFMIAISMGSLIIWALPQALSSIPILHESFMTQDWQGLFYIGAVIIFLGWLIVNNIFFNVAMIVFFDSLLKPINGQEREFILKYQGFLLHVKDPGAVSSVGRASH
ncbi:hypothetical protein IPM19_04455 [bacterium]|nr:MAG: hypothetical protein IPM19_04455 [bacterium]